MAQQDTVEEVSEKLKKVKQLEEILAKSVAQRVNRLSEDCIKAVTTDSHNARTMVIFRLDCLYEFLQNLIAKVQDGGQQMDSVQETDQYHAVMIYLSSLGERLDKVEYSGSTHTAPTQQAQIQTLQARLEELATAVKEKHILTTKDSYQCEGIDRTDLANLKLVIERMDAEKKYVEAKVMLDMETLKRERLEMSNQFKQEIERVDKEKTELESDLRQKIERVGKEKTELESDLRQEIERVDKEKTELESDLRQKIERVGKEKTELESDLRQEIERVDKEKTELESDLRQEIERVDKEKTELESDLRQEIERVDKEKTELESDLKQEIERADAERLHMADHIKRVDGEKRALAMHLKQEIERADAEKLHMSDHIKRVDGEKRALEMHLKQETDRVDKEKREMEIGWKQELERMGGEKSQMIDLLKRDVKRVDEERLGVEKQLMEEVKRIEREWKKKETRLDQDVNRIDEDIQSVREKMDGEKKAMETHLNHEVTRIDGEQKAMKKEISRIDTSGRKIRSKLQENATKLKTFKRSTDQRQIETKVCCAVLAKKVVNLKVMRNVLNQINQTVQSQPNTQKMVQDTQTEVASLKTVLGNLDARMNLICRPHVGFTVALGKDIEASLNTTIERMNTFSITSNAGNCFNSCMNCFVAPHDGSYVFCVRNSHAHVYKICLMCRYKGCDTFCDIFFKCGGNAPRSSLCVVNLLKGQEVYLKITEAPPELRVIKHGICTITFSGWSVGYH